MIQLLKQNKVFYLTSLLFFIAGLGAYIYWGKEGVFMAVNQRHLPFLDLIMPVVTFIGDGWFAVIIVILCSFIPFKNQLQVFSAWMISFSVVSILKNFVFEYMHRPASYFYEHPERVKVLKNMVIHVAQSFPSGHTSCAFAVLGALAFVSQNRVWQFFLVIVAASVGWSRVYLGQHFVEDILGGVIVGCTSVMITSYLFRKMHKPKSLYQYVTR